MVRGRSSSVCVHGSWACMGHGRAWVMGVHGSWVRMGHGRLGRGRVSVGGCISVMGCWLWAFVMHGWGVVVSVHARRPWVVGRGVVLVPGHCRLGVVCGRWVLLVGVGGRWVLLVGVGGCWVLLVGVGCLLWALGILCGCWVVCRMWVGAPSCAVHLVLPHVIVVGRDVVVGRGVFVGCGVVVGLEVIVACCRGPGSQLV